MQVNKKQNFNKSRNSYTESRGAMMHSILPAYLGLTDFAKFNTAIGV